MAQKRLYPVGAQFFPDIIQRGGVYVDKTEYVCKLAHSFSLANYYTQTKSASKDLVSNAFDDLRWGRASMEHFLESVGRWYHSIPYSVTDRNQNEQFYQAQLYALLVGIGADVSAEQQTSDGRLDIAMRLPDIFFILEFKLDGDLGEAMSQMRSKGYADAFATDPRPVSLVAFNISRSSRTIDGFVIEQC